MIVIASVFQMTLLYLAFVAAVVVDNGCDDDRAAVAITDVTISFCFGVFFVSVFSVSLKWLDVLVFPVPPSPHPQPHTSIF